VSPESISDRTGTLALNLRGSAGFDLSRRKGDGEAVSGGEGEGIPMLNSSSWVVVGLDNGGNCNSATVLDGLGAFW